jgi:hypothetical protein
VTEEVEEEEAARYFKLLPQAIEDNHVKPQSGQQVRGTRLELETSKYSHNRRRQS